MSWSAKINSEPGIIEITYRGELTPEDMKESTSKTISIWNETGIIKILADVSEVTSSPSLFRVFMLPKEQYEKEGLPRQSIIALILPRAKDAVEGALFYETVCMNRGWNVKAFIERQSAIDWLCNL